MTARTPSRRKVIVGVISDTHGLLRREALAALAGSQLILHAGDVGGAEVLAALRAVAPVVAVRGNNDHGRWAEELPGADVIEVGGVSIYLLHDRNALELDPAARGYAAVVSGHSHRPGEERRDGVLYFNPGSAGPRRFRLPTAVGRLTVQAKAIASELIYLDG